MMSSIPNFPTTTTGSGNTKTNRSTNHTTEKKNQALFQALQLHQVQAHVSDVHHYRPTSAFWVAAVAVETDYIITVTASSSSSSLSSKSAVFPTFCLAKPYSALRTWTKELQTMTDRYTTVASTPSPRQSKQQSPERKSAKSTTSLPPEAVEVAKATEMMHYLIESQHTEYLGKLSWKHVRTLAAQRQGIINQVLTIMTQQFPTTFNIDKDNIHPLVEQVQHSIMNFFLTDHHVVQPSKASSLTANSTTTRSATDDATQNDSDAVVIVPHSERHVRIDQQRVSVHDSDDDDNSQRQEEQGGASSRDRPPPTVVLAENHAPRAAFSLGSSMKDAHIWGALLVLVVAMWWQRQSVWNGHVSLLLMAMAFVAGRLSVATTRGVVPINTTAATTTPRRSMVLKEASVRDFLRRSMNSSRRVFLTDIDNTDEMDTPSVLAVTMPRFPKDAAVGTVTHCWSPAICTDFKVRGPEYLKNHKKVPSSEFLLAARGVDLFLTDACPAHVGQNGAMFQGRMRDVPTFVINFRLPWGVLVFYFEIPDLYLPFVRAGYETDFDTTSLPSLQDWSPAQRALGRFFQADAATKNEKFKIIPIVVDGPWIVRQVVGGTPAIIGKKVPIDYVYGPSNEKENKALYLEADLDIAASAAARNILSVVRTYTSTLTLDLGFVVQGDEDDELPECMMVGCRMHRIDPMQAPDYPSTGETFLATHHRADSNVTQ